MEKKSRPFRKEDWYDFAGAEQVEGKPPMTREFPDAESRPDFDMMGNADITGVELYFHHKRDTNSFRVFRFDCRYELSTMILEALPDGVRVSELIQMGFNEV